MHVVVIIKFYLTQCHEAPGLPPHLSCKHWLRQTKTFGPVFKLANHLSSVHLHTRATTRRSRKPWAVGKRYATLCYPSPPPHIPTQQDGILSTFPVPPPVPLPANRCARIFRRSSSESCTALMSAAETGGCATTGLSARTSPVSC